MIKYSPEIDNYASNNRTFWYINKRVQTCSGSILRIVVLLIEKIAFLNSLK